MKIPREVTQDIDPASEPEDAGMPRPAPRPVDGTAESLYTAERQYDPLDEKLGHTGELAKAQGQAEVENKVNRRRDGETGPQPDGASESPQEPEEPTHPADEHEGATEEQVTDVPAPAGSAFKDEPKQG